MTKKNSKFAYIISLIGLIGLSFSAPLGKFIMNSGANPISVIIWRMIFTIPIMCLIWIIFNKKNKQNKNQKVTKKTRLITLLSGFFLGLHFTTWYLGLANTTVFNASALVSLQPIYVMFISYLVFKTRPEKSVILPIAIALIGSFVLILPSATGSGESSLFGNLMATLSGVFFAVYLLCGKKVLKSISLGGYTTVVYSVCLFIQLLIALIFQIPIMLDKEAILICLILALASTVFGHSLVSWSLQYVGVVFVTVLLLGEPVGSATIAYIMFGTIPGIVEIIGGVVVILGIALFIMMSNKANRAEI